MSEVDHISQIITEYFRLNARLWQVSVLVNIMHKKKNVYVIASTNASKSLVYQAILIVTKVSILIILPAITLMED